MTRWERAQELLDNPIVAGIVTGLFIAAAFASVALAAAALWPLWSWIASL